MGGASPPRQAPRLVSVHPAGIGILVVELSRSPPVAAFRSFGRAGPAVTRADAQSAARAAGLADVRILPSRTRRIGPHRRPAEPHASGGRRQATGRRLAEDRCWRHPLPRIAPLARREYGAVCPEVAAAVRKPGASATQCRRVLLLWRSVMRFSVVLPDATQIWVWLVSGHAAVVDGRPRSARRGRVGELASGRQVPFDDP